MRQDIKISDVKNIHKTLVKEIVLLRALLNFPDQLAKNKTSHKCYVSGFTTKVYSATFTFHVDEIESTSLTSNNVINWKVKLVAVSINAKVRKGW